MGMTEVTSQDTEFSPYLIREAFTGSSREEEVDIREELDRIFSSWVSQYKNVPLYESLSLMVQTDVSSIYPRFKLRSETSLVEKLSEEEIVVEMLEHDFIVRMLPKKSYTIELEVTNIRRAKPRIVEPEEF
jgi:hypothetical protein